MDLKEAIRKRHSTRKFNNKPPSEKVMYEILSYAHLAPSAGNLQARDVIIIHDGFVKEKLMKAALNQTCINEAPIAIVVCANLNRISPYGKRGTELYCIQDAAAAVEHILLLAVDYGLAACWIGAFDETSVSTILNLPSHIRPVAIIPIGYANEKPSSPSRIDIADITHHNKW